MNARAGLLVCAALIASACAPRWKADESARIDEVIRRDRFDPDASASRGIALQGAPELAPPWRHGEGYQIGGERKKGRRVRLGQVSDKPPRVTRERVARTSAKAKRVKEKKSARGTRRSGSRSKRDPIREADALTVRAGR